MPTASAQRQIIADVAEPARIDWNGNEDDFDGPDFETYVNTMPSRADLKPYPEPVMYWEVKRPGCAIHPYPRMGQLLSLPEGVWICQNKAMHEAVREHLRIEMMRDPEHFRLTEAERITMKKREQGTIRYCQSCAFMTCNLEMSNLHESETGHNTRVTPRHPSVVPEQER